LTRHGIGGIVLEWEARNATDICVRGVTPGAVPSPKGHRHTCCRIPLFVQNRNLALVDTLNLAELYQPVGVWFGCNVVLDRPKEVLKPLGILRLPSLVKEHGFQEGWLRTSTSSS
jgi:hypothetical protein